MAELGFPQIKDYTWVAVLAPSGTPADIVNQVNLAIQKIIDEPETKEKLLQAGLIPVGGTAQKTNSYINDELKHWGKGVVDTKAKAE